MANFIKLTTAKGDPVRINMDGIEAYGVITKRTYDNVKEELIGLTFLSYFGIANDGEVYVVKETPEEIDILLECEAIG